MTKDELKKLDLFVGFIGKFNTNWYKTYKPTIFIVTDKLNRRRRKDIPHAGYCLEEERKYYYCKKELKELGVDMKQLPVPSYYTSTNGYYRLQHDVYFYDIRKCELKN